MRKRKGWGESERERQTQSERKIERVGGVVGDPEGLRDPREMLFDTGNRSDSVTKSRKTGPLRPRRRDWRSRGERKSDFFNKLSRGVYNMPRQKSNLNITFVFKRAAQKLSAELKLVKT